jgi:hypothetical protein
MNFRTIFAAVVLSASFAAAQTAETPQLAAAHKLQADLQKALPTSSLNEDEKTQLTSDAALLVTNATTRAQGGSPDRKAGRAAGTDIGKKAAKLQPEDGELIKQDLKALQAAAQ